MGNLSSSCQALKTLRAVMSQTGCALPRCRGFITRNRIRCRVGPCFSAAATARFLNPPSLPLDSSELDAVYSLPFVRRPHPGYTQPIPAYETVKHSLRLLRGCFGGCSFCSVSEHEGRVVQSRSPASVVDELRALQQLDDFSGVVSDLGGPTANMYGMACSDETQARSCRRLSCRAGYLSAPSHRSSAASRSAAHRPQPARRSQA